MRRRSRIRRSPVPEPSTPSWMITFSDLCTLLIAFFVLILSMSTLNPKAVKSTFGKFNSSVGRALSKKVNGGNRTAGVEMQIDRIKEGIVPAPSLLFKDLPPPSSMSDPASFSAKTAWIRKEKTTDSFSFILDDELLFVNGSMEIQPDAALLLEAMSLFLRDSPYRAFIAGHTDAGPTGVEQLASGVDPALQRAEIVLFFLLSRGNISPKKVALGSYGSSRPIAGNTTQAGRRMNRRVEILFERVSD